MKQFQDETIFAGEDAIPVHIEPGDQSMVSHDEIELVMQGVGTCHHVEKVGPLKMVSTGVSANMQHRRAFSLHEKNRVWIIPDIKVIVGRER